MCNSCNNLNAFGKADCHMQQQISWSVNKCDHVRSMTSKCPAWAHGCWQRLWLDSLITLHGFWLDPPLSASGSVTWGSACSCGICWLIPTFLLLIWGLRAVNNGLMIRILWIQNFAQHQGCCCFPFQVDFCQQAHTLVHVGRVSQWWSSNHTTSLGR